MKISHEVPTFLLEESLKFNDYQYALPHLLDSDLEYRKHFLNCKENGVEIYMDNSLHELGYALEDSKLIYWLDILEPSNFFIPDAWEDLETTLKNAERWVNIGIPKKTQKIAVVQAKSFIEIIKCIESYKKMGYKKFAFSYGASYYNEICPHPNKDLGKAIGRFMVIDRLYDLEYLNKHDKVHLLGCSLPLEFGFYKNIPIIESIDTSNPVMAAFDFKHYKWKFGIDYKPHSNMNNTHNFKEESGGIKADLNNLRSLIDHNVRMFRTINKI